MLAADIWLRNFAGILLSILNLLILIRVLLSWFPVDMNNPIVRLLIDITEPILAPFRRIIPRIGMFDLSPLAALLVLQFIGGIIGGRSSFF